MKPDMAVKEVLIGKYCHVQVSSVHSHVIHSLPAAADVVIVVFVIVVVVVVVLVVVVVVMPFISYFGCCCLCYICLWST